MCCCCACGGADIDLRQKSVDLMAAVVAKQQQQQPQPSQYVAPQCVTDARSQLQLWMQAQVGHINRTPPLGCSSLTRSCAQASRVEAVMVMVMVMVMMCGSRWSRWLRR